MNISGRTFSKETSKMEIKEMRIRYCNSKRMKIYRRENDLKRHRVGWKKPDPGKGD